MKRAIQRALAQQDIGNAFDYYLRVAGATTANDFVLAIDASMGNLECFPGSDFYSILELIFHAPMAIASSFSKREKASSCRKDE